MDIQESINDEEWYDMAEILIDLQLLADEIPLQVLRSNYEEC